MCGTKNLSCGDCGVTNCNLGDKNYPAFCLTTHLDEKIKEEAMEAYNEPDNHNVMVQAADVEYEGYGRLTRVEETIEFAKRMGFKKIGIATCVGLIRETRMLTKILRHHGFEVYGIACKVGAQPKTSVGIREECCAVGANMCNPILQAKLLNEAKTDLNIVMGLCVGHDSLFYKYAEGLTTTMVVKDRVTGHNPVAAIYNAESYYQKELFQ